MKGSTNPSPFLIPLLVLAGLVVICIFVAVTYRPDRPVATIAPGSSSGSAFTVQIIRPRAGLPLGGIAPPQLFGLEGYVGADSQSAGAYIRSVGPGRIELGADKWEVILLRDAGRVTTDTYAIFELEFREQLRSLRCRPGDPVVGTFELATLEDPGEMAGSFDIELARCEYADTGKRISWPAQPLVLHGSFDRVPAAAP